PRAWAPYGAAYGSGAAAPVEGPGPNNTGVFPLQVINTGANTWPANGPIQLTYHMYTYSNGSCTATPYNGQILNTAPSSSVAPGQSVTINAQLGTVPLGTYCSQFDMIDPSQHPAVLLRQEHATPTGMYAALASRDEQISNIEY